MLTRFSHPIAQFIIAALAYYLAGQFGRLLSIPPGFASAVWPASGIALALAIKFRLLPALLGTALGSFLLNVGIASNNFQSSIIAALIPSAFISSGAFLQALVGSVLFKRVCRNRTILDTPTDVIFFTLIVGVVSCFVSSSVGTSSLLLNGIVAPQNYFFTWATWWIGDSIGVLLFTPLSLLLLDEDPNLRSRKIFVALPIGVIFAIVLILFFSSMEKQKHAVQAVLNANAQEKAQRLEDTFQQIQVNLQSFLAFYQSSTYVTQEEFIQYSTHQLQSSQVLKQVAWIPLRKSEAFGSQWEKDKLDLNQTYEYARDGNFNNNTKMTFQGDLKQRINESFNLNHTSILIEASETGTVSAVLFSLPIKKPDKMNGAQNQSGIVLGILTSEELGKHIYHEGNENRNVTLNFSYQDGSNYVWHETEKTQDKTVVPISNSVNFQFNNIEIGLRLSTNKTLDIVAKNWESWYILTGGLLITAFFQIFILLVTGYAQSVRSQVEEQTQAYLQAKDQAEKANAVKSQFLANMNHELRTPLNATIGFLRVLHKTDLNAKQLQLVERASLAGHALLDLVTQTLDYAKLEAGRVSVKNARFELLELMEKLYAVFIGDAETKGLEFKISLPEITPGSFVGDAQRIEQLLLHLLSNAIKFTEQGSVTFSTSIKSENDKQYIITFLIQDTGVGIEEENMPHLFQPFNQADNSPTRQHGGTGLGLTICRELVELMDGEIQCTSTPGEGSAFKVTLPLLPDIDSKEIRADDIFREKHA